MPHVPVPVRAESFLNHRAPVGGNEFQVRTRHLHYLLTPEKTGIELHIFTVFSIDGKTFDFFLALNGVRINQDLRVGGFGGFGMGMENISGIFIQRIKRILAVIESHFLHMCSQRFDETSVCLRSRRTPDIRRILRIRSGAPQQQHPLSFQEFQHRVQF